MAQAYEEAKIGRTSIYRVDAPFDEALKILGKPMSMLQLAEARLQAPKDHSLNINGSYCAEGFNYSKGVEPVIQRQSILLRPAFAEKAVEANRVGKYFITPDKQAYEIARAEAEQDSSKELSERRAIILPSRKNFAFSPKENSEVFEFLLGKDSKYLAHVERDSLNLYLVDPATVDAQDGTLLTQLWFHRLVNDSYVYGNNRFLDYDDSVRRVRAPVGAKVNREATQKISESKGKAKLPYTQKQLDRMYNLAEGVRQGNLPNSKLETLASFIENLRKA